MLKFLLHICVLAAASVSLGACAGGRLGLGLGDEPAGAQPVSLKRDNTATNRAIQVGWTAARAQYCAFGMDRNKLRSDYLAYEAAQGVPAEEMAKITKTYDVTFESFYARIRGIENYCTKARIEEIRPDIKRHLRGDYSPSDRKPPKIDPEDVYTLREDDDPLKGDMGGMDQHRDW